MTRKPTSPQRTLRTYIGQYPGHTAKFYASQLNMQQSEVNTLLVELCHDKIVQQSFNDFEVTAPTYAPMEYYAKH